MILFERIAAHKNSVKQVEPSREMFVKSDGVIESSYCGKELSAICTVCILVEKIYECIR